MVFSSFLPDYEWILVYVELYLLCRVCTMGCDSAWQLWLRYTVSCMGNAGSPWCTASWNLHPMTRESQSVMSPCNMEEEKKRYFFLGGGESTHLSAGLTYFLENNLRVSSLRPSCDVFWSYWLLPQSISDATAFLTLSTVYSFLHFWLIQGTHYSYDLKDVYSLTCDGWWIYSWLNFKWIWFYWN